MKGHITMSTKEARRVSVLEKFINGQAKRAEVAIDLGVGERQVVLVDHLPQECQPVVEVLLPQPDGIDSHIAELFTQEFRLEPFVLVPATEEVPTVALDRGQTFFKNPIQITRPPGKSATLMGLSPTGLDLALDVRGIDQMDIVPVPLVVLGVDGSGSHPGADHDQSQKQKKRPRLS